MISGVEALERLLEGNRRFVADIHELDGHVSSARRIELVAGQDPFAIILGCSDSRVPAELVFDQGLGDLFVIRVAGNIVAPSLVGSVEFAAERFGTRLVLVMGHSCCGAVRATLEELEHPGDGKTPNLRSVVERIEPALKPLIAANPGLTPDELMPQAVRENIHASMEQLNNASELLVHLIETDGLLSHTFP